MNHCRIDKTYGKENITKNIIKIRKVKTENAKKSHRRICNYQGLFNISFPVTERGSRQKFS